MRPVRTLAEIEADLKSSSSDDFIARGLARIRARQADLAERALTRWRARCGPFDEAALVRAAKTALRLPRRPAAPPLPRGWDPWGKAGAPPRQSAILDRLGYLLGWLEVWHEAAFEVIEDEQDALDLVEGLAARAV